MAKTNMTAFKTVKTVISGIALICIITLLLAGKDKDPGKGKIWLANEKLTWKDFRDTLVSNSHRAALTDAGIHMNLEQNDQGSVVITAICEMYHDKSWVDTVKKNGNLLSHEQYHFNITEYWCRKLKKEFAAAKLTNKNMKDKIGAIYKENFEQCRDMQNEYDKDTNHSEVVAEQRKWEKKVDELLKSVEQYAGPAVTVAVK
jgi:hypothetical protein